MKTRSFLMAAMFTMAAIGLVSAIRPGIVIVKDTGELYVRPTTTTQPQLIGGQTDTHGCLIPAGFSWNETAEKCMRPWSGETQIAGGTIMVNMSDPNWRDKINFQTPITTDIKCVDTDNGNIYKAGEVYELGKNKRKDYCIRNKLREWSCVNGKALSEFMPCKKGCKQGACLPEVLRTQLIGPR